MAKFDNLFCINDSGFFLLIFLLRRGRELRFIFFRNEVVGRKRNNGAKLHLHRRS